MIDEINEINSKEQSTQELTCFINNVFSYVHTERRNNFIKFRREYKLQNMKEEIIIGFI